MSKKCIFYSCAGEGLGHACRTQSIIDNLPDHEIHLFTYGDALEFYRKQGYPYLYEIAGLRFGRTDGKIDLLKTINNYLYYRWEYKDSVKYVLTQANLHKPDLFISDFEGVIPKVARKVKKPILSIDNQHKFSRTTSKGMPLELRLHAFFMGLYAEWVCPRPDLAIISTFYHSAVKKRYNKRTILTNCFIRKSFESIEPTNGDYVLVYFKSSVGPKMLDALTYVKEKVIVFNCPVEKRIGDFDYRDIAGDEFVKVLAGCKAVFCASGNQLLGEAAYYGKPIFTIPEPNQAEQYINGYYIVKMNCGVSVSLDDFKSRMVLDFLANCYKYGRKTTNGVQEAVEQIKLFSK